MKLYDKNNLWMRGSYTVEAAFVVPVVLGIIFALMYVLFFEHDKLTAYGNVREGILECAINGEELPEQFLWKKQIQSNLWMGEVTEGEIAQDALGIKGTAKIKLQLAIPVMHFFLNEKQEINCEETWEPLQPAQVLRWKEK